MDLPKMLFVEPTFKTQFGAEHAAAVDIGGAWIFEGRAEAVREAVTRYNAHEALVELVHRAFCEGFGMGDDPDVASVSIGWQHSNARAAMDAANGGA